MLRTSAAALAVLWRPALLALASALIWCAHYERWTRASWAFPTDYGGESLEMLARIQASSEGDTAPLRPQVISRLGAPFGANWSAYPSSDLALMWVLGRSARIVGLFETANLAMLVAVVSSALAFYGCARWLRVRWEWAFAMALLFAFTFQNFHRGLPHLFFLFTWTVPLALLACGLIACSRRLKWRGATGIFCALVALLVGMGNPYPLFLFLQLVGWALLAQWLGPRRRDNLIAGGVTLALAFGAFFVAESHVWLFTADTAAASPLVRNYGGTERYALKPIELLLPPATHRWEPLAFLGQRYERWSEWRGGEAFSPYLGVVGVAGFAWLVATALRAVLQRRRVPGAALPAGWILAFASMGGLTNILAFFTGVVVFRATNRFSVFISAIVLLFFAARMARWFTRRARSESSLVWCTGSLAAAAFVAVVGLIDQLPRAPTREKHERIARRVMADRELGRLLEENLAAGAMVFQLPVLMFPEVTPPHHLNDYEHFRPYLATRALRFSYGALKNRSRGRWQRDTELLPTREAVGQLERYGFSAVYFNRRGYADGGEKLLAELAAAGRTRVIESALREQVVVLLEPTAAPELPAARTLTFGRGWHNARPGDPRWAYGPATFSYFNPHAYRTPATLRLGLSGVGRREVRLRLNGDPPIAVEVGEERQVHTLALTLAPGFNRIDIESPQPAVRVSRLPGNLRSFAVHSTNILLGPQRASGAIAAVNQD